MLTCFDFWWIEFGVTWCDFDVNSGPTALQLPFLVDNWRMGTFKSQSLGRVRPGAATNCARNFFAVPITTTCIPFPTTVAGLHIWRLLQLEKKWNQDIINSSYDIAEAMWDQCLKARSGGWVHVACNKCHEPCRCLRRKMWRVRCRKL